MLFGNDDVNRTGIINDLVDVEKENCLAFANVNLEIVLPNNLDTEIDNLLETPIRMSVTNPVGIADVLGKTPNSYSSY